MHREKAPLLPEARDFVEKNVNGTFTDASVYARAVRASTIAGKVRSEKDIFSTETNCLGANIQLGEYLSPTLNHSLGLVLRFGWQPESDQSGIHIVSLVKDPATGQDYFVDPMPAAGYMYGTTGELREQPDGTYRYWDEGTQSSSSIKPLSEEEAEAIGLHYFAKGYVSFDTIQARRVALDAAAGLSAAPGYLARNFLLLDQINEDEKYTLLNADAPVEGIRSSQVTEIQDPLKKELLNNRSEEMSVKVRQHIARAAGLLVNNNDAYTQNYWAGVKEELTVGFTAMNAVPHASLSHKYFSGPLPVKEYEQYMLSHHPGYSRSDLYRAD